MSRDAESLEQPFEYQHQPSAARPPCHRQVGTLAFRSPATTGAPHTLSDQVQTSSQVRSSVLVVQNLVPKRYRHSRIVARLRRRCVSQTSTCCTLTFSTNFSKHRRAGRSLSLNQGSITDVYHVMIYCNAVFNARSRRSCTGSNSSRCSQQSRLLSVAIVEAFVTSLLFFRKSTANA